MDPAPTGPSPGATPGPGRSDVQQPAVARQLQICLEQLARVGLRALQLLLEHPLPGHPAAFGQQVEFVHRDVVALRRQPLGDDAVRLEQGAQYQRGEQCVVGPSTRRISPPDRFRCLSGPML